MYYSLYERNVTRLDSLRLRYGLRQFLDRREAQRGGVVKTARSKHRSAAVGGCRNRCVFWPRRIAWLYGGAEWAALCGLFCRLNAGATG